MLFIKRYRKVITVIIRSKAPLRLGLAGGGTDVSPYTEDFGGHVLNATLDMYAYCNIEVTNDNKISFYAADRNERFESESKSYLQLDGNLDLHKGIYNRIVRQFTNNQP